jgi:hypothetical protein
MIVIMLDLNNLAVFSSSIFFISEPTRKNCDAFRYLPLRLVPAMPGILSFSYVQFNEPNASEEGF